MSSKRDKKRSKKSSRDKRRQDEGSETSLQREEPSSEAATSRQHRGASNDDDELDRTKQTKKSEKGKLDHRKAARGSGSPEGDAENAEDVVDGVAVAKPKSDKKTKSDKQTKSDKKAKSTANASTSARKDGKTSNRKDGAKRQSSRRRGSGGSSSPSSSSDEADVANNKKKLADGVNVAKDAKEMFSELQARRAANLVRCRLALCLSALVGVTLVVVGAGLLIAFGFFGLCTDADFSYSCGSFECCATACNATASFVGASADAAIARSQNDCKLVVANPVEISGTVLLLSGWVVIVAALVCFVQVNRVARLDVPASVFGNTMVASLVLIVLAIIAFIIAALPEVSADTAADITSIQKSLLIFAITAVWPGVILLIVALVGLYMAWKSQATSRKKKVLVLGLSGSGKSYVARGIVAAAERRNGRRRSGTVLNMGGKSTSGVFVQAVTRTDGFSLQFLEAADLSLLRVTRWVGVGAPVRLPCLCALFPLSSMSRPRWRWIAPGVWAPPSTQSTTSGKRRGQWLCSFVAFR